MGTTAVLRLGTSAPIKKTHDVPKRIGNPFAVPLSVPADPAPALTPVSLPEKQLVPA